MPRRPYIPALPAGVGPESEFLLPSENDLAGLDHVFYTFSDIIAAERALHHNDHFPLANNPKVKE